jgi:hypothetical protein
MLPYQTAIIHRNVHFQENWTTAMGREHPVTVRFAAQLRYRAGQLKLAKQSSKVPGEPAEVVLPCNSSGYSADVLLHLERGK